MNEMNEHGVPLHACNGYRHDQHYWAWIQYRIDTGTGVFYDWLRDIQSGRI